MKSRIILICALLFAPILSAKTESSDSAVTAALAWLQLCDAGKYPDSWTQAGESFRTLVKQADWVEKVSAVRNPLGALVSRVEKSREHSVTMPGMPDGEYYLLKFDTSYANKKAAVETVTMQQEKDGIWRVIGYFIR